MHFVWLSLLQHLTTASSSSNIVSRTSSDHNNNSSEAGHFHHTWSIIIRPGHSPHDIARDLGLEYVGPIGQIPFHHHFKHRPSPRKSPTDSGHVTRTMLAHLGVISAVQQKLLSRKRRSVSFDHLFTPSDPLYSAQWFLQAKYNNVTGAWAQGVSGEGVVVTVLDDGLEYAHPDLEANYEPLASWDMNDNDRDPAPRYDPSNENKHGTRCAGEIASVADNSYCGVGAAYKTKIGGIRMLDGDVTDIVEASALGLNPDIVDIYSSSWGPDDDGQTVDGPGKVTEKTFKLGIEEGRRGLGSIFVWASGNGGATWDNCNCDGYTNSIWTISIGAVSMRGEKPWYAEECSSTIAVTYSSGSHKEPKIVSTDLHSQCTEAHTGTSAAAPLAAGILALTLHANPGLGWRDTQHLLVRSSKVRDTVGDWARNAAGHEFSHQFGFGVIDAGGLVEMARRWTNVGPKLECESSISYPAQVIPARSTLNFTSRATGCGIKHLEHVQAVVTIAASRRGDISLTLISPSNTPSQVLNSRPKDPSGKGFSEWPFMSVHFWGEPAMGTWTLSVTNSGDGSMKLQRWWLVHHGTEVLPELRNVSMALNGTDSNSTFENPPFRGSRNNAASTLGYAGKSLYCWLTVVLFVLSFCFL